MDKTENETAKKENFTVTKTEKLPRSLVVIEAEIPAEILKKNRDIVLKKMSEKADIPGFRKGHVPESVLISKVGEMGLLEEAAEEVLHETVPLILAKEKTYPLSNPKIEITALAIGNPLKFKMTVPIMPEFEMPDYKALAKKVVSKKEPPVEVAEKEITDALEQIRKIAFGNKATGGDKKLPEINDETIKQIGNFKNVDELKERIKKDIKQDKENKQREKRRLEISEKIIEAAKIEIPDVLVENELGRMEGQFRSDIERMGMKFEDYLAKIKKTLEELRKEWGPAAEKRVKYDIIAGRIAGMEKITPKPEEIEHESKHILEHYKDANENAVRNYVEHMLIHQKVFEFLEKQT